MTHSGTTRSEGDSWDPATSVGATATGVAASRALASKGPSPLIDDPFAEPLVRAVGIDAFIRLIDGEIPSAEGDPAFDTRNMAEEMAVRTRYFDGFIAEAVNSGVRQVVIVAAGLDARAYRLEWPAGTVVYEVDQPQVIDFKTRTLADFGAEPTADRRTVGIDLRDDWPVALQDSGFDPARPTAWLVEGLLIYLPPEAQDALFDNITSLSVHGSRVATEYVPDMSVFSGERSRTLAEQWKRLGLDVDMGALVYSGERSHVVEYLSNHGWQTTSRTAPDLFAQNGFIFRPETTLGFADIEYISATLP